VSEPYLAEIRVFGFNFAPLGWGLCNGALLPISQNAALFDLLGTTYGGNGTTTFALPNLQGNLAVGAGAGPGLQNWILGELQGEANHTLLIGEVPPHTHQASASGGIAFAAQQAAPTANSYFGREKGGAYAPTANTTLAAQAIGQAGGNQPHSNSQPSLAMNYSIALQGIFPTPA
jgi:microcystin-dependent protein